MLKIGIPSLLAVASGGSIGIAAMIYLLDRQRETFANQASFLKSAIKIAQDQPAVKEMLGGSEIIIGRASFRDEFSKMRSDEVRIRVPLKGESDIAYLYAYAKKRDPKDKFRLTKVEMTFNKIVGKKLILLERSDKDIEELIEAENKAKSEPEPSPQPTQPQKKKTNKTY